MAVSSSYRKTVNVVISPCCFVGDGRGCSKLRNCVPHVQHAFFYVFKLLKFFNNLWVVDSIFIVDAKTVVINNDLVTFFRVKSEVHHKTF